MDKKRMTLFEAIQAMVDRPGASDRLAAEVIGHIQSRVPAPSPEQWEQIKEDIRNQVGPTDPADYWQADRRH